MQMLPNEDSLLDIMADIDGPGEPSLPPNFSAPRQAVTRPCTAMAESCYGHALRFAALSVCGGTGMRSLLIAACS